MLFLSAQEKSDWLTMAEEIVRTVASPEMYEGSVRSNLSPVFSYYIGTFLAARGQSDRCTEWLREAALTEHSGLFSAGFLLGFLTRNQGGFSMPAVAFREPLAFLHFTGIPLMQESRKKFIEESGKSLPHFDKPLSAMDIGCGDGGLTVALMKHLQDIGKVDEIARILLIDSSPAMLDLAEKTIRSAFPDVHVSLECSRIQDCSARINQHVDLALSSLAYHHMPLEEKRIHLEYLKPRIDNFLLFEMDANNDTPELYSPELALSVYQSYGGIVDRTFSYDAPVEVAVQSLDQFLLTEIISFFTEPRGIRSDYHMLQNQWYDLFTGCLGPEFSPRCWSPCYADEYTSLFLMHFGNDDA